MKRLTGWHKENPCQLKCFEGRGCPDMGTSKCDLCKHHIAIYATLAAYVDTGLSPEEITKMNDFINSQCAKLLAERDHWKARAEALERAIFEARDCSFMGRIFQAVMSAPCPEPANRVKQKSAPLVAGRLEV